MHSEKADENLFVPLGFCKRNSEIVTFLLSASPICKIHALGMWRAISICQMYVRQNHKCRSGNSKRFKIHKLYFVDIIWLYNGKINITKHCTFLPIIREWWLKLTFIWIFDLSALWTPAVTTNLAAVFWAADNWTDWCLLSTTIAAILNGKGNTHKQTTLLKFYLNIDERAILSYFNLKYIIVSIWVDAVFKTNRTS